MGTQEVVCMKLKCVRLKWWEEIKDTGKMFSVQEGCSDRVGCVEFEKQLSCWERRRVR